MFYFLINYEAHESGHVCSISVFKLIQAKASKVWAEESTATSGLICDSEINARTVFLI